MIIFESFLTTFEASVIVLRQLLQMDQIETKNEPSLTKQSLYKSLTLGNDNNLRFEIKNISHWAGFEPTNFLNGLHP